MNIWAFPSFYPYDKPGLRWKGIFAHRQYKGLIENGANLKVVQPIEWHPFYPFYKLDKKWNQLGELNYPTDRLYDNVKVYHPKVQNLRPSRLNKPYDERYSSSIINFFKKEGIVLDPKNDIFFSQWIPDAYYVQMAAHKLGVKSAVLIIGDDVLIVPHKSEKHLKTFTETWGKADLRLAVADYLGKEANKLMGASLPYHVVRRGVNYDVFKPLGNLEKAEAKTAFNIPHNKIAILTIGASIIAKGWLDMLDALVDVRKTNSNFVFIAVHAGGAEINLNEEVAKRDLSADFINLGEVDPKNVNQLINAADIFCLPSHSEGISNAVVESMSAGLPVITTNICGHPEVIASGINGILIPMKHPEMLSSEILKLLNNEIERERLGKEARNFIVNEWGSFADNAKQLYALLNCNKKESDGK